MVSIGQRILGFLRHLLEWIWGYLGTVAAMVLLLGVLGMGIYHVFSPGENTVQMRFYTGVVNPAEAIVPTGLHELTQRPGTMPAEPCVRFEYRPGDGRLLRVQYVDAAGKLSPMPGSDVAEQRMEYDASGRLVARRNYDTAGAPVADASGVATREFVYTPEGALSARIMRDAAGRKVVPHMPGFAEERITRDAAGRPLMVRYLDEAGNPITNAAGESELRYTYDDARHEVERSNYVKGRLTDNAAGVAVERISRPQNGHVVHTTWHNAEGEPVPSDDSVAFSQHEEWQPVERIMRTRRCGADGALMNNARVWAEHVERRTPAGAIEWERFNGSDGLPCENPACGYAERVCEYAADGSLEREYRFDALGNPAPCYEKRHSATHTLSLRADGSSELRSKAP